MEIRTVDKEDVMGILRDNHYSKGSMPRVTRHWLGCFDGDNLVGAITLGYGTQPKGTGNKILPEGYEYTSYLEIGRMAMLEEMPRNSESQMMKALIKWAKKNTDLDFIYTMADGSMAKVGYVYQASNFVYLGSYITDVITCPDGYKYHPKAVPDAVKKGKTRPSVKSLEEHGWDSWFVKMYRYIYPLNKKARRALPASLPYPKEEDLHFARRVKGKYIKGEVQNFKVL